MADIVSDNPRPGSEPDLEVITRQLSPREALDGGLIWAINRVLLHPRGYALALNGDTGQLTLWGNGDEPWEFRGIDENAKMRAFTELLASVTAPPTTPPTDRQTPPKESP